MSSSQSQMSPVMKVLESTLKEEIVSLMYGKLNPLICISDCEGEDDAEMFILTGYISALIIPGLLQGFYLLTLLRF